MPGRTTSHAMLRWSLGNSKPGSLESEDRKGNHTAVTRDCVEARSTWESFDVRDFQETQHLHRPKDRTETGSVCLCGK